MDEEIDDILRKLPQKYITDKRDTYYLTIVRNEREGNENAWIAMYSKKTCMGYSDIKYKIKVEGYSLLNVLREIEIAYKQYKQEQNI